MTDLPDESADWADEYGVDEPEMWGFLVGLSSQGVGRADARERAEEVYGDD